MVKTNSAGRKKLFLDGVEVGEVDLTGDHEKDIEISRKFLKDKGLYREIPLFDAILNQATAFCNTAAYLYETDLKRSPRKGISGAPFVVNAAFSMELYLKALAQKHGMSLRGHELVKLHKALPKAALVEIETVIPRCAAQRNLGEPPNFLGYLKNLNDAFVTWRYSYEIERTEPVTIEPTIFVLQVLHEACHLGRIA